MKKNPILEGDISLLESVDTQEIIDALVEAITHVRTNSNRIMDFKRFGFVRLPLTTEDRTSDGYVFHAWEGLVPPDACPHTHSFALTSRVMHGGMKNSIWEITDSNGDFSLVRPVCGEDQVTVEQSGVLLRCIETLMHTPDSNPVYRIGKNVFHSSEADRGTSTLVYRQYVETTCPINAVRPEQNINVPPVHLEKGWQVIDEAMRKITRS